MADATLLEGVEIVAQAPEVTASEDTLVYNSSAPSIAYATVYPIAMVFLILFIQFIASLIV